MNLFVYGTLADRAVLSHAIGRRFEGEYKSALLKNFIKLQPGFFMAFAHEGAEIKGKLVTELGGLDFDSLDEYEGVAHGLYRRKIVKVQLLVSPVPQETTAHVYVNGPTWKKEDFMK